MIFAALWLGLGVAWCVTPSTTAALYQEGSVTIHADETWYRSRPETEREWMGVLQRRDPVEGPGARATLRFSLVTGGADLAVYAAGVVERLEPFVDRHVTVRGKLVDLSDEGFGPELWIGSIRAQANDPPRR